jgi:hypothetical protein
VQLEQINKLAILGGEKLREREREKAEKERKRG